MQAIQRVKYTHITPSAWLLILVRRGVQDMGTLRLPLLLVVAILCLKFYASRAQLLPAIYIFGDSTVDAGNNDYLETIFKANFPPYGRDFDTRKATGRFCNGRLPTDHLASLLGLPLPPAYLDPEAKGSKIVQGVSFATAGSGFLEITAANINVPGLKGQLQWFREYKQKLIQLVGQANATSILSRALVALSTGSNDFVNTYYLNPILQKEINRNAYRHLLIKAFEEFIKELYDLGARRFSVVSLSTLGCIPTQITLYGGGVIKCIDFANKDAVLFNQALNSSAQSLRNSLPDSRVAYIDVYTLFSDVIRNPSQNGFEQTLTGCCGIGRLASSILCNEFTPGTCPDASKYVFWDSFHSTDKMNLLIANAALTQGLPQLQ